MVNKRTVIRSKKHRGTSIVPLNFFLKYANVMWHFVSHMFVECMRNWLLVFHMFPFSYLFKPHFLLLLHHRHFSLFDLIFFYSIIRHHFPECSSLLRNFSSWSSSLSHLKKKKEKKLSRFLLQFFFKRIHRWSLQNRSNKMNETKSCG